MSLKPYVDPIPELKRQIAELTVRELKGTCAGLAGGIIGADDRRATDLRHGRLQRFSLETLIRFATRAGLVVELSTHPRRYSRPKE